jgi:predicted nucleotidyltransferase
MDREQEIINSIVNILVKFLNPSAIYLFGSRASNTAAKHSDFDFALDCNKPNPTLRRQIEEEINKVAGLYKVDIVYLLDTEEDFRQMVYKNGRLIHGRKS